MIFHPNEERSWIEEFIQENLFNKRVKYQEYNKFLSYLIYFLLSWI